MMKILRSLLLFSFFAIFTDASCKRNECRACVYALFLLNYSNFYMNDIFEPNNNFSEAKCLDEKKIPSGLFIFYLPLFPNSNQRDVDYYYLNLSKDKPFSLVQSEVKTNLGYQIEFYDQNLQPIQINFLPINLSNEIKFQEFSYTPLTTGKYYFKIQLKSSESYNGIYTLNFKVNGYGDYTFSYANPCEGN